MRCSSSPADLERRLLATVTGDRAYFDEVFPVMSDNPFAKPRILATVQQFDARQASSAPLVAMQWQRGGGRKRGTGLKVRFQVLGPTLFIY